MAGQTDQIDGGEGGQEDHSQPVHLARGHETTTAHDGQTGSDSGNAQPEIRNGEERGQHPCSLVGLGEGSNQADAALEARAEADTRDGSTSKEEQSGISPEGEQHGGDAGDQRARTYQKHARRRR